MRPKPFRRHGVCGIRGNGFSSMGGVRIRQRKLGELFWLAEVSLPDISARLAQLAARVNSIQASGIYRINNLIKTAKEWQQAPILKYATSSCPSELVPRSAPADCVARKMRARVERGTLRRHDLSRMVG